MRSDFIVSKDRPKVTHLPTGMVWEFRLTPKGYWACVVVDMNKCQKWPPTDQLARLSRQAGEALQKEWTI